MNKNVPIDRALWLAKCVGTNELRASKRKGVNPALPWEARAKWIKDWTISVEQFVEGLAQSQGQGADSDPEKRRSRLYYGYASVLSPSFFSPAREYIPA